MSTASSQQDPKAELSNQTQSTSYAGMATSAAGTAAETATNAAAGVKDTMFSMFGGGAKKEVKDEQADEEDRSGSAKAIKEKEKEKEKEKGQEEAKEGANVDEQV